MHKTSRQYMGFLGSFVRRAARQCDRYDSSSVDFPKTGRTMGTASLNTLEEMEHGSGSEATPLPQLQMGTDSNHSRRVYGDRRHLPTAGGPAEGSWFQYSRGEE